MSRLQYGDVNPLAVANIRRLGFCPAHFQKIKFKRCVAEKLLLDWIYENTDGRFYYSNQLPNTSGVQPYNPDVVIGFEEPGEISYLALMLPTINSDSQMLY